MNTTLHVVQVCALAALIGAVIGLAVGLARRAAPGLGDLLNHWVPVLVTLGLRLRGELTRRRK